MRDSARPNVPIAHATTMRDDEEMQHLQVRTNFELDDPACGRWVQIGGTSIGSVPVEHAPVTRSPSGCQILRMFDTMHLQSAASFGAARATKSEPAGRHCAKTAARDPAGWFHRWHDVRGSVGCVQGHGRRAVDLTLCFHLMLAQTALSLPCGAQCRHRRPSAILAAGTIATLPVARLFWAC